MTCIHGWRPPVSLNNQPHTRGHVAALWATDGPAVLPPTRPPPSAGAPHAEATAAGRSARRPPCDRSVGSAPGELYAAGRLTSVRFRRRFRGWSRAFWCRWPQLLRLSRPPTIGLVGKSPAPPRFATRVVSASPSVRRQVRRPTSHSFGEILSLPNLKKCGAPRCSRCGVWFWFGCD